MTEGELMRTGQDGSGAGVPKVGSAEVGETDDAWLRQGLHDLCQPLTALDCLLYVNREPKAGESLEAGLLRNVMAEGLIECGRMLVLVRELQDRLTQRQQD